MAGSRWERAQVAQLIDHTLLKPEATASGVQALIAEAAELGVKAICVSPSMVAIAAASNPAGIPIATVVGFPSGKHRFAVKAHEAACAHADGASEIDMVIDIGAALDGDFVSVAEDIATVRGAVPGAVVKVIIESAVLLTLAGDEAVVAACRAAQDAGADFVKTSTGFHPCGGASVHAVTLMAHTVGATMGIKASGGIRTADDAIALLDAGATRLGVSGTRAVLDGLG